MLKVVCYESGTKSKPLATERDFNLGKVKQMHQDLFNADAKERRKQIYL